MSTNLRLTAVIGLTILISTSVYASQETDMSGAEKRIYEYDILREGGTVGSHKVQVQYDDESTLVESRSIIEVGLLGLTFYQGHLHLDAWYDISGRWMGMRFKGRDGSTIEYRCRNCNTWKSL